jgi:hypothetical protein
MKSFAVLMLVVTMLVSEVSLACGSHGMCGGGGVNVQVAVGVQAGGCGGGACGGAVGFGPRPLIVGGGAVAFRRSRRLARRANRAAFFGFFGRANRLAARSDAALGRAAFRNARFNGF